MIVSAFAGVGKTTLARKYNKDVIDLESGNFKWLENGNTEGTKGDNTRTQNPNYPINYLEAIKKANNEYKVVLISQHEVIRKCLDAVKLDYILVYPDISIKDEFINRYKQRGNNINFISLISKEWDNWINALDSIQNHKKIKIQSGKYLEDYADQIGLTIVQEDREEISNDVVDKIVDEVVETVDKSVDNNLTVQKDIKLSDMMDSKFYIDDLTLRELKSIENNVRAGMLIQAKNRLQRVDRMLDILNKLEDELFDRFEKDVTSMSTSKIVETTKFISSLVSDTNSMIMSVIGNPKLQNFFIVDNSSTVNIEDAGGLDESSRKKVRHAVQVILENIDKVSEGHIEEIKDPNVIVGNAEIIESDVSEGDSNVN